MSANHNDSLCRWCDSQLVDRRKFLQRVGHSTATLGAVAGFAPLTFAGEKSTPTKSRIVWAYSVRFSR